MTSALQTLVCSLRPSNLTATSSSFSKCSKYRQHSTAALLPRLRNWRTGGIPAPPSLIHHEQKKPPALSEEEDDEHNQKRPHSHNFPPHRTPTPRELLVHQETIRSNFPEGWNPQRKLSRDAMEGVRSLHAHDPTVFTTPLLAEKFRISPEAVRRILKSKWQPSRERRTELVQRERKTREEWIKQQRVEERMKQIQQSPVIEREVEEREYVGKFRGRGSMVRGVSRYDKFSLH